jgi:protoporphyrinogen oxidase
MIVVVGAGISGLGVALNLKGEFQVLEKTRDIGGLAREIRSDGYLSGFGGHFFHFQNRDSVKDFLSRFCYFDVYKRSSRVLLFNTLIPYPMQYHLGWLKKARRDKILQQISYDTPDPLPGNLDEFLELYFGPELKKIFFQPFQGKFWQVDLREIIANADKGTIPLPRKDLVAQGAQKKLHADIGYNVWLHYPQEGMSAIFEKWRKLLGKRLTLGEEALEIDVRGQTVQTNRREIHYRRIVNTMPLKVLLERLRPRSPELDGWRRELQNISTLVLNFHLQKRHRYFNWVYLPSKSYPFYRVGYYPFQPVTVYLEMSYRGEHGFQKGYLLERGFRILRDLKMVRSRREILGYDFQQVPVSYIIFNKERSRAVQQAEAFLNANGIFNCGRFASWNYSSMAEDLESARELATRLNRE